MDDKLLAQVQTLREERDSLISGNSALKTENESLKQEQRIILDSCTQMIVDKNKAKEEYDTAITAIDNFYKDIIDRTNALLSEESSIRNRITQLSTEEATISTRIEQKAKQEQTIDAALSSLTAFIEKIKSTSSDFDVIFSRLVGEAQKIPFDVREWIAQYEEIMVRQKEQNREDIARITAREHNLNARDAFTRRKETELNERINSENERINAEKEKDNNVE